MSNKLWIKFSDGQQVDFDYDAKKTSATFEEFKANLIVGWTHRGERQDVLHIVQDAVPDASSEWIPAK